MIPRFLARFVKIFKAIGKIPDHIGPLAYLCLCQYAKELLWGNLVFQLSSLVLVFLCGTRKEAHMETRFPPIASQIRDTTRVTHKKHVIIGPRLE